MPSSRRRTAELQGARPQPLNVAKTLHQIKKPPVIIHLDSPKIIHTRPQDFMRLVQQLTGNHGKSGADLNTCEREIDSEGDAGRTREGAGENDPLLPTDLGQIPALEPNSAPSLASPGFFSCSPSTKALLQELGLLF